MNIEIATVNIAYGKENAELAELDKLPISGYDSICFNTKAEAQAYCAGIIDANGWDEVYTEITTVEIPQRQEEQQH